MDEKQIQDIVDRVVEALNGLKPAAAAPKESWEYVASFGSWAALVAAIVAFFIGWWTIRQKREADARAEWWRRTQWALEASASENDAMNAYGTGMLDLLARSELASPKDKELLDAVWEVTDTEMQDDNIEQLLDEAANLKGLNPEQQAVVSSYFNVDGTDAKRDNEDKSKSRNEREGADGPADQ